MEFLLFVLLLAGGLVIAFALSSARPLPGRNGRQGVREALASGLRRAEREADRLPIVGPSIARARRRELHYAIRDRLPSFWGDLRIYLEHGQRDLRGAILAGIDRLDDPLSKVLHQHLEVTQVGGSMQEALQAACEELNYRAFTAGIKNLTSTEERGGNLPQLLAVLRDQAMAQLAYERREQAATLENRLILLLWPILFAALMTAILLPIAVGGLGAFLKFL